jgi:hypothetical protein
MSHYISEWLNQSVETLSQYIIYYISEPLYESFHQSVDQSVGETLSQYIIYYINEPLHESFHQSVDQSVGETFSQYIIYYIRMSPSSMSQPVDRLFYKQTSFGAIVICFENIS